MKKQKLLILTAIPFLLVSCGRGKGKSSSSDSSSSSSEEGYEYITKDIDVKMVSHFGENFGEDEVEDTCSYSDRWFLSDSKEMNYNLALASAMTGGMSYSNELDNNGQKITHYLQEAGFTAIQMNRYYSEGIKLENSIGAIIGNKAFKDESGKPYTLLAVFPRNAGYASEWYGNFNIGASGIHEGFLQVRDEMLRFMKHYIVSNNISGDLKVWTAGYSRGAAAVNLLGGFLADASGYLGSQVSLTTNNIYAYTIGTPNVIPENVSKSLALSVSGPRADGYVDTDVAAYSYVGEQGVINPVDEKYNFIHNFTAIGDYITKLPPVSWSFTRFGSTEKILYGDKNMLKYLEQYSPETAAKFAGGRNYAKETPTKNFDFTTLLPVNEDTKQSPDQMIEGRLNALMGLADSREGLISSGYADVLGAMTAVFGTDFESVKNVLSNDLSSVIKAGVLAYLAHVVDSTKLSDSEAVAALLMNLMELCGKTIEDKEAYTDQQFLADLFDYLINDYQSDPKAVARAAILSLIIPEPYSKVYTGVLNYAKKNELVIKTFDDFLYLVAAYATENKDDETVLSLIDTLAGLIPESYMSYIAFVGWITGKDYSDEKYPDSKEKAKAAITDLLECCVLGSFNDEGEQIGTPEMVRSTVISLLSSFALSGASNLQNLLANGTHEDDGTLIVKDPVTLDVLAGDILKLALPKDDEGATLSIKDAADKAVVDLLGKCRSDLNGVYIDKLMEKPEQFRKVLVTILFNPGDEYKLSRDIGNAYTFIDTIQFLFPAHNHEMYIAYLKGQVGA